MKYEIEQSEIEGIGASKNPPGSTHEKADRRAFLVSLWDVARSTPMTSLSGSLSALLLSACGGGGGGDKKTNVVTSPQTLPTLEPNCAAMAMPGGGTQTPQCVGGAPAVPGTPTPVVPPAPGTTAPVTPPAGGVAPPVVPVVAQGGRTFTFLGPDSASVTASMGMMMQPLRIPTNAGDVGVWVINGPATGFNGDRVVPGPVIELTQGQPAAITLTNMSMAPHTIHPHGLDVDTANDGVPATSFAVPPMGSNVYRFTAPFAGTYFYHCHVDAALHVEMGMYGAVIVRPPGGAANVAWAGGPAFDREYIWQLSTFDTRWHTARQTGAGTLRYRPNVFLLNGRDGARLTADTTTAINAPQGSKVLVRLISYGAMPAIVEFGGIVFDVIASDGRPLKAAKAAQTSWLILPGERYDLLMTLPPAGTRQATVRYQNIRGTADTGTIQTTVTST